MEEQDILKLEEGEKEDVRLKPANVKIVRVKLVELGEKKNKKIVCECKHPDRDEPIDISAVRYERNNKLVTTGLWVNLDEDNKIRKGSALAVFMRNFEAINPSQLQDKVVQTIEDEKGYLVFKNY